MKRRFLCLVVTLSFVFIHPAFAQSPQRGVSVAPTLLPTGTWGTYHALIIGINDYKEWPQLQTAVKDATVIRNLLVARYGFAEKNVILRTDADASRFQIERDLRYFARLMEPNDNLFIYYAGHGQLDDLTGDGYWVPAEGAMKNPSTWVANSYIKAILSSEKVQAKNVVVIADSCYSGSMLRGGPSLMSLDDKKYRKKLEKKATLRSRQVISSGGVEPVADGGAEGHSLFAFYLIDALRKNDREVIDLENLFHTRVWKKVTEIGDQRPNVGRLKTPMDEDGQFVLYNTTWAQERARKKAAMDLKRQKQSQTKAAVATAELELQRQRFEMEKQKLALEKERLNQEKTLELQRLKVEQQKQEIEYAKLQAQLEKMKAESARQEKTRSAELEKYRAAVDRSTADSRQDIYNRYRIALFPVKIRMEWQGYGGKSRYVDDTVKTVAAAAEDDIRLKFGLSFKGVDGITGRVKIVPDFADSKEHRVWAKKSLFSKNKPDIDQLKKVGKLIDADLAALIALRMGTADVYIDTFVYDFTNDKLYARVDGRGNWIDMVGAIKKELNFVMKDF